MMTAALLEMVGVGKRFGDLVALEGVGVKISPGSVHGVGGEERGRILDEPGGGGGRGGGEQLFGAGEGWGGGGGGVVFISHRLGEVRRICDGVTVLRGGRVVWEGDARSVSAEELAREMVG